MQGDEYLELRLGDFLERLGAGKPWPGSGSASALTVAFAAGVVAMVARRSEDSWEDSPGIAAQALALQAKAAPLALADAQVWEEALDALAAVGEAEPKPNGDGDLERKLDVSTTVPLQIAETAADTAILAALAAQLGDGTYRSDAAAAAVLAAAGASAAAHLVAVNLTVQEGDHRLARARACAQHAEDAAARALDSAQ